MKVIFQVGRTELQPDRYGNQKVLDEIMAGVEKLRGMEKYQFSGVEINGFASPEGGLELNTRLGQKRAERLQEYIQSQMPDLTSDDFRALWPDGYLHGRSLHFGAGRRGTGAGYPAGTGS